MSLDLSALDALDTDIALPVGTAPRAPLSQFYEDPEQPRLEFDTAFLERFAAEVKDAGTIHTAINVHPPDPDGRMKIIHGAQRHRASVLAGVPDIPYLIQTDTKVFDAYSQVSENQQRRNLSPRELALFIDQRIAQGDTQNFIAGKLGVAKSEITCLLTLVHGPDYIVALYEQQKCQTPRYLYELATLARTHPEQVRHFCRTSEDFGRRAIESLKARLRDSGVCNTNARPHSGRVETNSPPPQLEGAVSNGRKPKCALDELHGPGRTFDREKSVSKGSGAGPGPQKSAILAKHGKRRLIVVLSRAQTHEGLVHVRYLDDRSELELPLDQLSHLVVSHAAP